MDKHASLSFTKMHGAGNDFILFDNRAIKLDDKELAALAPSICDRKFGIGADGVIALQFDDSKKADLVMLYKNPDGSDAGMCGNGARCFSLYAVTLGSPKKFTFRVHQKIYQASVRGNSATISFPLTTRVEEQSVGSQHLMNIYTNTEHVVCPVQEQYLCNEEALIEQGRTLRRHEDFHPLGTNVNFIAGVDKNRLCLQTYERGVENLTLACGTGAIASALGWHHLQQGASGNFIYKVKVKGGTLTVKFSFDEETKQYSNIKLKGPATFVFEGQYYL
ncbi:MAG: diaminopimelate epimerase [Balneolaceae bacterium]|nr:MAG: diaminopimelate epimerase [Balneolaceae bacterium]